MLLQIITFYCVCDEWLHENGHKEPLLRQMTTAEVMTTVLTAVWFFSGNLRLACQHLKEQGHIPRMLEESRFLRRVNAIPLADWQAVLSYLSQESKEKTFLVDSCPVSVCHLKRAGRSRLYSEERKAYFGYCASKSERFYGLKVHLVTDASGCPVEIDLTCGSCSDITALKELPLALPKESVLYADKGYTDYRLEARLLSEKGVCLQALRRKNSLRPRSEELTAKIRKARKRIETTFSRVTEKFGHHIHAVTEAGFETKVVATFVAYAICSKLAG